MLQAIWTHLAAPPALLRRVMSHRHYAVKPSLLFFRHFLFPYEGFLVYFYSTLKYLTPASRPRQGKRQDRPRPAHSTGGPCVFVQADSACVPPVYSFTPARNPAESALRWLRTSAGVLVWEMPGKSYKKCQASLFLAHWILRHCVWSRCWIAHVGSRTPRYAYWHYSLRDKLWSMA